MATMMPRLGGESVELRARIKIMVRVTKLHAQLQQPLRAGDRSAQLLRAGRKCSRDYSNYTYIYVRTYVHVHCTEHGHDRSELPRAGLPIGDGGTR